MRRVVIISYTETGGQLNRRVADYLNRCGNVAVSFYKEMQGEPDVMSTSEVIRQEWNRTDAFIFIGAIGIAVRHVAPLLKSKVYDPAVLVLDEKGQFVIPVVSGHIGGGVMLARELARYVGGQTVITTATDVEERFAVDVFAHKNHLWIESPDRIKIISSALLQGRMVDVWTHFPIEGKAPEGLRMVCAEEMAECMQRQETGNGSSTVRSDQTPEQGKTAQSGRTAASTAITIGLTPEEREQIYRLYDTAQVCDLKPRQYLLGVGCKKGKTAEELEGFLRQICEAHHINIHEIGAIASIDAKKEEPGIWELSRRLGAVFEVFSADELEQVEEAVTASDFVKETVGVDNVCERSAYLLAGEWTREHGRQRGNYSLVLGKQAQDGMTMAIVKAAWSLRW